MRIREAAAALCLVAVLGACGDDPEPRTLPPVASVSPSPSVVPLPSEAAAETPEGAAAFARYYLELMNAAFGSRDAEAVRQISTAECEGCQNLIRAIEQGDEPGEVVTGGEYRVVFAEAPPISGGDVIVEIRYDLTEVRVEKTDGTVERLPAKRGIDAQMRLLRREGQWVVQGFRNAP